MNQATTTLTCSGYGKAAQNHIKELKADFGLDAFNMHDFWATEAALGFAMPA